MDKLEAQVHPLTGDQTLQLLKSLEEMGDGLLGGLTKTLDRVHTLGFQGKDTQLKIKQDFHTMLALADRHFMEHVSQSYLDRYRQYKKRNRQKPRLRLSRTARRPQRPWHPPTSSNTPSP
jgi:hypothetical protein